MVDKIIRKMKDEFKNLLIFNPDKKIIEFNPKIHNDKYFEGKQWHIDKNPIIIKKNFENNEFVTYYDICYGLLVVYFKNKDELILHNGEFIQFNVNDKSYIYLSPVYKKAGIYELTQNFIDFYSKND